MSRQVIDISSTSNNANGDSIREAFRKTNENFRELYNTLSDGSFYNIVSMSFGNSDVDNATITKFSTDTTMADNSDEIISTQHAVTSYVSRRLGVNQDGSLASGAIGAGFLDRNGVLGYTGGNTPFRMGNSRISEVGNPSNSTDAANKGYVDGRYSFNNLHFSSVVSGDVRTVSIKNLSAYSLLMNNTSSLGSPVEVTVRDMLKKAFNASLTSESVATFDNSGFMTNTLMSNGSTANTIVKVSSTGSVAFKEIISVPGSKFTGDWTLSSGSTLNSTYADLAEYYTSDSDYDIGTVLSFGGSAEVTMCISANDRRVAGVVSDKPAFVLNVELYGQRACIALQGRTPVKVIGEARKGDLIVSAGFGFAKVNNNPAIGTIIGKCLIDKFTTGMELVEVAVGRF